MLPCTNELISDADLPGERCFGLMMGKRNEISVAVRKRKELSVSALQVAGLDMLLHYRGN